MENCFKEKQLKEEKIRCKKESMCKIVLLVLLSTIVFSFTACNSEKQNIANDDNVAFEEEEEFDEKVRVLEKAKEMYEKVNIGDKKSEVISKLGSPNDTFGSFLTWNDSNENPLIEVTITNDKVSSKAMKIYSSKYNNVKLGEELGTTIDDLTLVVDKIKDEMTLEEVKKILGDVMFESGMTEYNYKEYTWYDKQEKYVEISFNDEGKVIFVTSSY